MYESTPEWRVSVTLGAVAMSAAFSCPVYTSVRLHGVLGLSPVGIATDTAAHSWVSCPQHRPHTTLPAADTGATGDNPAVTQLD
ncbi:hypothetical protein [Streptomyces sp. NPDC001135]